MWCVDLDWLIDTYPYRHLCRRCGRRRRRCCGTRIRENDHSIRFNERVVHIAALSLNGATASLAAAAVHWVWGRLRVVSFSSNWLKYWVRCNVCPFCRACPHWIGTFSSGLYYYYCRLREFLKKSLRIIEASTSTNQTKLPSEKQRIYGKFFRKKTLLINSDVFPRARSHHRQKYHQGITCSVCLDYSELIGSTVRGLLVCTIQRGSSTSDFYVDCAHWFVMHICTWYVNERVELNELKWMKLFFLVLFVLI